MAIQVLIEPVAKKGFRARSGEPLAVSVEAPTREEALAKIREELDQRLRNGAELVSVELGPQAEQNPWVEFAGMHDPNDPVIQDWKKAMADYRRKVDRHPELP